MTAKLDSVFLYAPTLFATLVALWLYPIVLNPIPTLKFILYLPEMNRVLASPLTFFGHTSTAHCLPMSFTGVRESLYEHQDFFVPLFGLIVLIVLQGQLGLPDVALQLVKY